MLLGVGGVSACAHVPAYDRAQLAHPTMTTSDLSRSAEEHVRACERLAPAPLRVENLRMKINCERRIVTANASELSQLGALLCVQTVIDILGASGLLCFGNQGPLSWRNGHHE